MGKLNFLCRIASRLGVLAGLAAAHPATVHAVNYSASGTHQCKAGDGAIHSCVVTGSVFDNCIDAVSSLQAQDCCPSSIVCSHDSQGRTTNCRHGGTSIGFTVNYCIMYGPPFLAHSESGQNRSTCRPPVCLHLPKADTRENGL
jgi:hypothetical protein